jgi:hypothetical protein
MPRGAPEPAADLPPKSASLATTSTSRDPEHCISAMTSVVAVLSFLVPLLAGLQAVSTDRAALLRYCRAIPASRRRRRRGATRFRASPLALSFHAATWRG